MLKLTVLNSISSMPFHGLTFASLQSLLYTVETASAAAVGATYNENPVGLALAIDLPDKKQWRLASLFVSPSHRNTGIGTALLKAMEEELQRRDVARFESRYHTNRPTTEAARRILAKLHWPSPTADRLICRCDRTMLSAPWLRDYPLRDSAELFWWSDAKQEEIDRLRQEQEREKWIPASLLPWEYQKMAPNSVGMRLDGSIVGWVLTQHFDSKTLVYSNSYMHPRLQGTARILPLYVKAVRRHSEDLSLPQATWVVPFEHPGMVRFVRRWLAPYMKVVEELHVSMKHLNAATPVQP
jgi:GNAT superfamily N-acetyltransferase